MSEIDVASLGVAAMDDVPAGPLPGTATVDDAPPRARSSDERQREVENLAFEQYYRAQLAPLLADAADWDAFMASLRSPLPVTFRISGMPTDTIALAVRAHIETELIPPLSELPTPAKPLPWYPANLAWQVDVSRAALSKKHADDGSSVRTEALRNLHAFLMDETDAGRVHRQEAASMVPPLLLDVLPGMRVLDM